mmetsp:Transcript_1054/g.3174  ORF Transcript_1054/g.3174 Transcript_1054/m.3174 type:complete len:356 (-) Transcript_1054:286-1353(-)
MSAPSSLAQPSPRPCAPAASGSGPTRPATTTSPTPPSSWTLCKPCFSPSAWASTRPCSPPPSLPSSRLRLRCSRTALGSLASSMRRTLSLLLLPGWPRPRTAANSMPRPSVCARARRGSTSTMATSRCAPGWPSCSSISRARSVSFPLRACTEYSATLFLLLLTQLLQQPGRRRSAKALPRSPALLVPRAFMMPTQPLPHSAAHPLLFSRRSSNYNYNNGNISNWPSSARTSCCCSNSSSSSNNCTRSCSGSAPTSSSSNNNDSASSLRSCTPCAKRRPQPAWPLPSSRTHIACAACSTSGSGTKSSSSPHGRQPSRPACSAAPTPRCCSSCWRRSSAASWCCPAAWTWARARRA